MENVWRGTTRGLQRTQGYLIFTQEEGKLQKTLTGRDGKGCSYVEVRSPYLILMDQSGEERAQQLWGQTDQNCPHKSRLRTEISREKRTHIRNKEKQVIGKVLYANDTTQQIWAEIPLQSFSWETIMNCSRMGRDIHFDILSWWISLVAVPTFVHYWLFLKT